MNPWYSRKRCEGHQGTMIHRQAPPPAGHKGGATMRGTTAPETMNRDTTRGVGSQGGALLLAALVSLVLACDGQPEGAARLSEQAQPVASPAALRPIGVALEIEDGLGLPLRVRAGQTLYINQLD